MRDGLSEKEKVRQIAIYLFSFVTIIYFISLSIGPNIHIIEHYNQRYEVTRSIVEKFDVAIPYSKGSVIKGIDDRYYSLYGLGWSILAVPFYIAGEFIGTSTHFFVSILNLLAGSATVTLVFLFTIALGYSRRGSLIVAIFYGLGTFAWPLAKQPFDHIVETLFVFISVYLMYLHTMKKTIGHLILSGLCLGIAINIRLVPILALPALLVLMGAGCMGADYDAKDRLAEYSKVFFRKIVIFMMVLLPFAGLVLWYNYYRFGSIFETGFQLLAAKAGVDIFSGTPLLTGLRGFLMSPGKGFFYYSPIAILFFFTIRPFFKKHRWPSIAFILLILSYLLFLSRNKWWHGDWAWGPRYLLAITPFVILPIAELLDSVRWRKNNSFIKFPVYVVFTLSLLIQISAVSVHFFNYFEHLQIYQNVQFNLVKAEGALDIQTLPPEVYFTWADFPILVQLKEIKRIVTEKKYYQYKEPPQNATIAEKLKSHPSIHILDFWWFYIYSLERSFVGFISLIIFLILASVLGIRMTKLSRRDEFQMEGS